MSKNNLKNRVQDLADMLSKGGNTYFLITTLDSPAVISLFAGNDAIMQEVLTKVLTANQPLREVMKIAVEKSELPEPATLSEM